MALRERERARERERKREREVFVCDLGLASASTSFFGLWNVCILVIQRLLGRMLTYADYV